MYTEEEHVYFPVLVSIIKAVGNKWMPIEPNTQLFKAGIKPEMLAMFGWAVTQTIGADISNLLRADMTVHEVIKSLSKRREMISRHKDRLIKRFDITPSTSHRVLGATVIFI